MNKALAAGVVVTALLLSSCSDGAAEPVSAGGSAGNPAAAGEPAKDADVSIKDFLFKPTPVRVPVGSKVTWTNEDSAVHSVVSKEKGVFGSEVLEQGGTFSFTAADPGTVDYVCGVHNYMTGQIVVE